MFNGQIKCKILRIIHQKKNYDNLLVVTYSGSMKSGQGTCHVCLIVIQEVVTSYLSVLIVQNPPVYFFGEGRPNLPSSLVCET